MLVIRDPPKSVKKVGARIGESRGDRFGVLHRKRKSIWRGKSEAGLRPGARVRGIWRGLCGGKPAHDIISKVAAMRLVTRRVSAGLGRGVFIRQAAQSAGLEIIGSADAVCG